MSKQKPNKKRLSQRVLRRRISLAIQFSYTVASIALLPILQSLGAIPVGAWNSMPIYYLFIVIVTAVLFGGLYLWQQAGEKDAIDELETKIDANFTEIKRSLNRLKKEVKKVKR